MSVLNVLEGTVRAIKIKNLKKKLLFNSRAHRNDLENCILFMVNYTNYKFLKF